MNLQWNKYRPVFEQETGGAAPAAEAPAEQSTAETPAPAAAAAQEAAPAAETVAPEPAPAAFDASALTLPEGFAADDERLTAFAEAVNGEGTPQERGQRLFDLYSSEVARANAAAQEQWDNLQAQWREEVNALPEFKGRVESELGGIKQALISLGADDAFFSVMDTTGAGSNPLVLSMLHKLTAPYREGRPVNGGAQAPKADRASRMYPTMATKG